MLVSAQVPPVIIFARPGAQPNIRAIPIEYLSTWEDNDTNDTYHDH